jgi:hypothetical protein
MCLYGGINRGNRVEKRKAWGTLPAIWARVLKKKDCRFVIDFFFIEPVKRQRNFLLVDFALEKEKKSMIGCKYLLPSIRKL